MATAKKNEDNTSPNPESKEVTKERKPRLRNELAMRTPFVSWHTGLVVFGEVSRKFENSTKYGTKSNIEVIVKEDTVTFHNGDGEVVEVKPGERLNIGSSAGLNAAMTLPVGALVEIECTGKVSTMRGEAWDFKVFYE